MRDAVQHTDLARAVVGGCNFCWRQVERAATVPQAVLRSTGLHPRRPRSGAAGMEVPAACVIRDGGGGGGGGGGGLAEAMAGVDAARARVTAARERVGGARATAAAVGGGIVAAVAGV